MIEYIQTTSIFEALFPQSVKKYFPNIDNIRETSEINNSSTSILFAFTMNPSVRSYSVQPRQFYEIFPLIGALLGLLKLFSLVQLYNEKQFEKELDAETASLFIDESKDRQKDENFQQQSLIADNEINNSTLLYAGGGTQQDPAPLTTKFKEVYSFKTFRDMLDKV